MTVFHLTFPGMAAGGSGHRRRGPSIFARQVVLYLVLILFVVGVISQLFLATARSHLADEIGGKLESVARIATRYTPAVRLALVRPGDEQARMVLRLEQRLEEIREATGLVNLYVFRPDLTSLLDLDPAVAIGAVYDLPQLDARRRQVLLAGHSTHTGGYATATGQLRMSAFAPVLDSTGAVTAVVGVDAGAGELEILERMRVRVYWVAALALAVACLAALVFARSITGPIRRIAAVAERLGSGDYGARAEVRTGDEVQVLAEAVNRMADQVRDRDTALKEMAASVAHEVRNPLNSMQLLLTLLAEDVTCGRQDALETIRILEHEVSKLDRFAGEFLTYSRPLTPAQESIEAASLAGAVVELAEAEARERGVRLRLDVAAGLQPVAGDGQRLEQALLNLVINGVQAAGAGGTVVVRVRPGADGSVALIVEDSGPGVPHEDRERIFEPFFTTRTDGTGLGLANVRKIATQHGGTVRVDSGAQGGARFVLGLPAVPPAPGESHGSSGPDR